MSRTIHVDPTTGEEISNLNKGTMYFPDEDQVNHPSHYQSYVSDLNIEAIDCMRAAFGDEDVSAFCLCNAMKYIFRCESKGGNESIEKAIWYLNKYLELNK